MLGGKVILTGTQYCIMVAQSTEINLLLYAGLGLDVLTNWLIVATAGCYYYWSLGCCWFGFEETFDCAPSGNLLCWANFVDWSSRRWGSDLEEKLVCVTSGVLCWCNGRLNCCLFRRFFFLDASFLAKWSRRKKGNIHFLVHCLVPSPEPLLTKVVVGVLLLRAIMMIIIMMVCRLAVFFGNNCVITAGYGWVDVATSTFVPIFSYLRFDRFWLTFLFLGSFVLLS